MSKRYEPPRRRQAAVRSADVYRVDCPTCRVRAGSPCMDWRPGRVGNDLKRPHRLRVDEARKVGWEH